MAALSKTRADSGRSVHDERSASMLPLKLQERLSLSRSTQPSSTTLEDQSRIGLGGKSAQQPKLRKDMSVESISLSVSSE